MKLPQQFQITLPDWCRTLAAELPECLPEPEQRMALAIDLSRRNVEAGSGGPFGAVVAEVESGRVLALGVNRVEPANCSSAHAEVVALSLAQAALAGWNLADRGSIELATSCEPCAMCLGAIPWSGVQRVLCGATKEDAERTGFDEGTRDPDWIAALARRGIEVITGLQREPAAAVLEDYRARGARIYNP
ncbi:MAG: nucleoside deaminase [Wenzhouxiangellaceae bacterium]|nr:nucleoside deaminase [Wenzhouxiangellaceae bacterium]